LLNSIKLELFSDVADEKEVKQIVAKIMEAKTVSSYNTLELIGKFISKDHLLEMLKPFKEQLDSCNSRKLLKKIEEALRRILLGLGTNKSLDTDMLMFLVYGLVHNTFDVLNNTNKNNEKGRKINFDQDKLKEKLFEDRSCFIIAKEPKRGGDKPKVQEKTNQHVITEFALQLLNSLMKANRLDVKEKYAQMLDPYLKTFVDYLDGKYLKVTIVTLRCLIGLLKFNLPSLENYSKQIATKLFNLLKTYSAASTNSTNGMSSAGQTEKGDNFELLMICYKVISNLIRDCNTFNLTEEQLQVLLYYAERNLYDNFKQAAAFNLLKAILSRKLDCSELGDVLSKIMKLSIQADAANVRLQSRQTILQYILDYSLTEKKLDKFLEFYIVQLNYEYENGRESALEMLATIFNTFPSHQLNHYAALFFIPLAIQLHNDESAKCKKLAYLALKSLVEKVSLEKRDELFQITEALLKDSEKPLYKRIAALLVKIYVEVEQERFERRLDSILSILIEELNYDSFIKNLESNTNSMANEKFFDHYLHNMLQVLMKILNECKILNNTIKYSVKVSQLFDQVKSFLVYEHSWVRLISCQLFGFLFANQQLDYLIDNKSSYFHQSTENYLLKIRDLIDAFCDQLKSPILDNELAEQIIKNLAFMLKVVNSLELKKDAKLSEEAQNFLKHDLNIDWLIKKVIKEAKYEMVNKPQETIKVFRIEVCFFFDI
jgi:U3 small nucleolar RNA-associated protein 20